jgi:glycine betaine/proline transport system permease protein
VEALDLLRHVNHVATARTASGLESGLNATPRLEQRAAAACAAVVFLASPWIAKALPVYLVAYPDSWRLPISDWTGRGLNWLARDAALGSLKVSDLTRHLASLLEWPVRALGTLLNTGVMAGTGENVHRMVPPLSWLTLLGIVTIGTYAAGGRRLAILSAGSTAYLLIFGLWSDAMATLASVFMATLVAMILGLWIGTMAFERPRWRSSFEAAMNVMQTVPVFAYLVPTLLFLGYGPSAALVATAIYAIPPMVHATILGLESVSPEIVEYGKMSGTTKRQQYWLVLVPSAMPFLGVGINQTIMASLNMVIISSMIGAGGLGYLVLLALRRLDIGAALEAGMGIVVLAVLLDRASQGVARVLAGGPRATGHRHIGRLVLGWLVASTVGALVVPVFQDWPQSWTVTTAPLWNHLITWINVNFFAPLDAVRTFALLYLMNPLRNYLLSMPWIAYIAGIGFLGYRLGGARLALYATALTAFVLMTGFWDAAVVSLYLVSLGVIFSLLIGMPVGYLTAFSAKSRDATNLALDTLQTLPTLVYIIPAVMLFRNGDFSAVLAIMSYAVAPAVRYAMLGFSSLPDGRLDAAVMCGATRFQALKWVRLPHAFPSLILGLNQTVMMAIAMLVITALVGTRDLGQQVFIALSRMDVGKGIVGGLAVAALALTADAMLKKWSHDVGR